MQLLYFLQQNLYEAGRNFFSEELAIKLSPSAVTNLPAKILLGDFLKGKDEYLLDEIKEAYLLGTVNDDSLANKKQKEVTLDGEAAKDSASYSGIIVFAIRAKSKSLTRSEIAKLTRALNRRAKDKPVVLLTLTGDLLNYSTAERSAFIQEWREGERVGKITMLKDINLQQVHAGHVRILYDMRINPLLVDSHNLLHEHWQKVFSVQLLNKQFYQELFHWYLWAKRTIKLPPKPKGELQDDETLTSIFTIRLLTRLLFVWFVKEKRLIPADVFRKEFVQGLLKNFNPAAEDEGNYYKAILQNLFFATLNTPMDKDTNKVAESRQFLDTTDKQKSHEQHTDQTKYRYEKLFSNPAELLKIFSDVPFLNGGLFECLDSREGLNETRYDGFSVTTKNNPLVPEVLFFGKEHDEDLSSDFDGDKKMRATKVRGLLGILNGYKFTITENTPLEEEIALDPELLGKVFENLLASYNPETKTTARKQTGSFYTPREIVSYMVDESLKAYLLQKLLGQPAGYVEVGKAQTDMFGNKQRKGQLKMEAPVVAEPNEAAKKVFEEQLEQAFNYATDDNPFTPTQTKLLIEAISDCKILDPACGSGAFPMGILHRMVHLLGKLDHNNVAWKQTQLQKAKADKKRAADMQDEEIRTKAIESADNRITYIEESFGNNKHELDYTRKLFLIENCIYGVDIQQIAVQIAKLRFFISLMAEQRVDDARENRNMLSMPNLETKFVAANTLIGLEKNVSGKTGTISLGFFENPLVKRIELELKDLRHRIFFTRKYTDKKKLKKEEKAKREELKQALVKSGFAEKSAIQAAGWDPFDSIHSAKFYDTETMFGFTNGFDVVIGNPPYVEHKKLKDISIFLKDQYTTYSGTGDLYVYFYEHGIRNLSPNGTLMFITSNKFIKTSYGENLRKYFTQYRINEIIDFTEVHVFEALVASCVFSVSKTAVESNSIKIAFANNSLLDFADVSKFIAQNKFYLNQDGLSEKIWQLENESSLALKDKIETGSVRMSDLDSISIFRGVTTGYNPAFIIGEEQKKDLIKQDKANKAIIKPLLQGRNIRKWVYNQTDMFMIFTRKGIDIKQFPTVKKYLSQFREELEPGTGRKEGAYNWYEIQDNTAYYPEFEKEKIIWGLTSDKWTFAYDSEKKFLPSNGYILTSRKIPIKFILALLNSNLMEFYFGFIGIMTAGGAFTLKQETVSEFPIKEIDSKRQNLFITLVDKILAGKEGQKDTSALERQIDIMVYHLYNLTLEEARVIDASVSDEEWKKWKMEK